MKTLIMVTVALVLASQDLHAQSTAECQKLFQDADINADSELRHDEAISFLSLMDEAQIKRSDPSSISYEEFMITCRKGSFNSLLSTAQDDLGWTGSKVEVSQALQDPSADTKQEAQFGSIPAGLRASDVIGSPVYTLDDRHIGLVRDVALSRTGAASQLILGVGGFLGLGEQFVSIELSKLKFVTSDNSLVLIFDAAKSDLADFNIDQ